MILMKFNFSSPNPGLDTYHFVSFSLPDPMTHRSRGSNLQGQTSNSNFILKQ